MSRPRVTPCTPPRLAVLVDGEHEMHLAPNDTRRTRVDLITEKEIGGHRVFDVFYATTGLPAETGAEGQRTVLATVEVPPLAAAIDNDMITPSLHDVQIERDSREVPTSTLWRQFVPTDNAWARCSCRARFEGPGGAPLPVAEVVRMVREHLDREGVEVMWS